MRATTRAVGALATAAVLGLVATPALAAGAATGDVDVVNTETVQVYLSPEGDVESRRVYEQLTMTGTGSVSLTNPVESDGLRNLGGFSGFEVRDGEQVVETDVDGSEQIRTVSEYAGNLPVSVRPSYVLDGKRIAAGDLVGRSGRLEVSFEVINRTSVEQEVTVEDGAGKRVTKTVAVPVPLVGSLATVLPKGFDQVEPHGASIAGDGKGGTRLSYTMMLFPPLGSDTTVLKYVANVRDGVVPQIDVNLLPIDPYANPTVKKAADSYDGGAATGAELVAGAGEIDMNLLKLRDGAAELLAGLVKLSDGAAELNTGLEGKAAPGSARLAEGAGQLDAGLGELADGSAQLAGGAAGLAAGSGQIDDGAGQLADGLGTLSVGTGAALDGGQSLTDGLGLISGGLGQLADQLPGASAGITQLQAGIDQLVAGMGKSDNPQSIIGGLAALEGGLTQLQAGSTQLKGGLGQLDGGLGQVKGGLDGAKAQLDTKLVAGGPADQLVGGLGALAAMPSCSADPVCKGTALALKGGAEGSRTDLKNLSDGLGQLSGGLGQAIDGLRTRLIPGAGQIEGGLGQALVGTGKLQDGADDVLEGLRQVHDGLSQLAVGVTAAVEGVLQLSSGADSAFTGSQQLTEGLGALDAGAGQLADGAGDLAAGAGLLDDGAGRLESGSRRLAGGAEAAKDGSGRLAAGAEELSTGLGDAAEGSGLIADGLRAATGGAPKLVDGAGRLSDEGMGKLREAGTTTALDYGTLSATIQAASERAKKDGMAYGAPEGARGLTAYSFIVKGADGESTRNWARGLGAAVLLGLGGLVAVRRRLV